VFLHVSWTEALPQVLFEAFASATPVVATDVGGIRAAVGEAAVMVPPGNAEAAAAAVGQVVADGDLWRRLVENGHRVARARTLDAEVALVLGFLHTTRQSRLP
jgi:glycosyltransferase involved in cell wall biosynthesis